MRECCWGFFLTLRAAGLKPGLGEFLALLDGMSQHLADFDREAFYFLSRTHPGQG